MSKRTLREALLGGPGLNGYAYNAEILCVDCGQDTIRELYAQDGYEPSDDTDDEPQPVFFGEADFAQHCAVCGEYCYGEDSTEQDEPDDDAITTRDYATFYQYGKKVLWYEGRWRGHGEPRSRWYYSVSGHSYGDTLFDTPEGDDSDDHKVALRAFMDQEQFWPDVWFISDHGNAHRIEL